MSKVKNLADLKTLRDKLKQNVNKKDNPKGNIQIKVAMATCAIASGARETMNFLEDATKKRNIDAKIIQVGCMGYCYAEPTIEVTLPGKEPVVFGNVNIQQADKIIEKYIKNGELIGDIIPINYKTVD